MPVGNMPRVLGFPRVFYAGDREVQVSRGRGLSMLLPSPQEFRHNSPPQLLFVQQEVMSGARGCGQLLPPSHRWLLWLIQQPEMEEQGKQPCKSPFSSSGGVSGRRREAFPAKIPYFWSLTAIACHSLTAGTIPLTATYRSLTDTIYCSPLPFHYCYHTAH